MGSKASSERLRDRELARGPLRSPRCAKGGEGKIEWIKNAPDQKAEKPPSAPFKLAGSEWQDVSVKIPATGPLGIVRLYVPAQEQSVEIDWIELKGSGAPKRWEF